MAASNSASSFAAPGTTDTGSAASSVLDHVEPATIGNEARADQATPSRSSLSRHAVLRRTSGFHDISPHSSPTTNGHESPSSENSPWSSAVGRATLGKSGRVIERLMADIDRLKRELNAEIQHKQEIEKQEQASQTLIRSLRAENSNLAQAKEIDAAMLKRRDRLIEDLRTDFNAEKLRRTKAEDAAREASRRGDEVKAESLREVGQAREMAKHAATHAEVLQQSHKQLSIEYRQRAETFTKDLYKLEAERNKETEKLKRLDVVVEQLGQELECSNKINVIMRESLKDYQEESDRRLQQLQEEGFRRDVEETELRTEIKRVVGEARYLLNVGKVAALR